MNHIIPCIDNFSRRRNVYIRPNLKYTVHRFSEYLDIPLNKLSENDVISERVVMSAESFSCFVYFSDRVEHIGDVFVYAVIHRLVF